MKELAMITLTPGTRSSALVGCMLLMNLGKGERLENSMVPDGFRWVEDYQSLFRWQVQILKEYKN